MSDKTIKEYLSYFEDVFLFKRLDRYHNKSKERIKSVKKLYVLDNGFLSIATKHSPSRGQALENWVFNHLYQHDRELSYLREQVEVDFYSQSTLYQVSYEVSDEKTYQREINAFDTFRTPQRKCTLVTFDQLQAQTMPEDIAAISIEQLTLG